MAEQLPLQFEYRANKTFANFYPGDNLEIVDHLRNCVAGTGEQQIYLWGGSGLGKSHLLQATSQRAQEINKTAFYYAFVENALPSRDILIGLDEYEVVCFDGIEAIAGQADWEHAFFTFYNRHREHDYKLILASSCPPNLLQIELRDLKTRLNWGLTLKLKALSDDESIRALTFKARQMGFDLSPKLGRFLLGHYSRDTGALWQLLDRIDRATLAAKRKLTLPLLKKILSDHDE
ncbi:MAG: DnaA regulatory inactivator Hda [Gammaproteobacteria bacterium]